MHAHVLFHRTIKTSGGGYKPIFFLLSFSMYVFNEKNNNMDKSRLESNENLPKIMDNSSTTITLTIPQSGRIKRSNFVILFTIFIFSILSLCTIYILFPKIDP